MAAVGTVRFLGEVLKIEGVDGTNNNDIIIETNAVDRYDTFMLSTTLGACDVEVNDGSKWLTTAPLSLEDEGSASVDPVIVTSALRQYKFTGNFHKLRVRQAGATACTDVILRCSRSKR